MKKRYVFGIVLLLVLFLVLCVAAVAEADGAATEFSAGTTFTVEGRTIRTTAIDNDLTIQFGNGTVEHVQADIPLKDMYCILKDEIVLVQELNSNWYNGTGTELTINDDYCKVTGTLIPESSVVLLETDGKMHAFSAGTGTGNGKLVIGKTLDLRDCIKTAHLGIGVDEEWRIDLTSEIRIDIRGMGYVSFTGSYLKTRIKGDFSFPKTKIEDYTCEFHSDKISVCLTDSQPLSREFTIVEIRKKLAYGLYLDFSPTLSIEKTGKGQVDFTFTGREGFYTDLYIVPSIPPVFYPTGAGWKHTKPTFQVTSVDVEGEFYAGPSWGMQLGWGKDLQIGPTMKWGKVFRAELSKSHFSPSSPDIWHACEPYKCVEGTSFFREGPFAVTASVAGYGFTILPLIAAKDHPPDLAFFKSFTFGDWAFTQCPHKAYRLLVYAERKDGGMPPARVRVDYSVIPEHYEEAASGYTDGPGAAEIFVPEGRYTVTGTAVSPVDPSRKVTVKQEIDKHKSQEVMVLDFDLPLATLTFDANIGEPVRYMPDPRTKTVDPFFSPKVNITTYAPEVISGRVAFIGWNTEPDGSGTNYAPGSTVTVEKDMTLYAQWSFAQDSWYIVYNANGGEKAPLGQVIPKGQAAVLTDEIAWWDSDIYFLGWSTEPTAIDPEYKPGDTVPYQQDVSFLMLYAVWKFPPTKPPVEIRYDANGVDGASLPAAIWVEPYTWIELGDALPPFGSDVQFLGWSANSSAAEPEYTAGQTAQFGEDTVLYAVWYSGAETVNLSFRDSLPGEVSGMPDDITILPSQSPELTIPDDIPEKPGYYFTGWNTAEDGNGTRYAPGSSFTLKVDTILYAQWQLAQNSWYILFNANGGVKAPLGQVVPKGQDAVLTDEIAEWDSDIYFRGWSTEPDAINPEYKPGDTVPYQQDVSFLMLYAVWEFPPVERPVEIRFDANGADGAEVPRRKWIEPYSWLQLKAAIPPIGGEYTFLGWDRNPYVRTPSFLAGDSYQFSEDTVLYAIWAKGQDTATLAYKDSLEGTVSGLPDPITINPSMSPYVRIPDNIPQKVGMVFTGWNTEKDGSGEGYAPGSIITVTEDTILYAQWTPLGNYWYIVYNANGGSDAPLTQLVQKGSDAVLEPWKPFHTDWIFLGWSRDRNAAKPEYQPGGNLPYDSSETFVTLYAVWYMPDSRTVTVTFDANGGDAGTLPGPISVPMLTWFPLPEKTPAWDPQHDFLGWDPKPKAAEPAYKAGDVVLFTKDTVLYAVWNPHYRIIQGAGSNWVKDSGKEHRFAADGNIAYFREFRFDGKALDSSEYKATSGSTIIDVSAAAMQKLSVGKHTVEVVYQDGSASAEFTVSKKIPKTGDTAELLLWNGLVLLGVAGLVFVIKQYHSEKRKKK